jgi:hypothetical protein
VIRSALPWLLVLAWSALQIFIARHAHIQQRGPIDFLTYQIAADNVARGESPYGTIDENLAIWRAYHRLEQLQDAGLRTHKQESRDSSCGERRGSPSRR